MQVKKTRTEAKEVKRQLRISRAIKDTGVRRRSLDKLDKRAKINAAPVASR
jgi:hypothetical protein